MKSQLVHLFFRLKFIFVWIIFSLSTYWHFLWNKIVCERLNKKKYLKIYSTILHRCNYVCYIRIFLANIAATILFILNVIILWAYFCSTFFLEMSRFRNIGNYRLHYRRFCRWKKNPDLESFKMTSSIVILNFLDSCSYIIFAS